MAWKLRPELLTHLNIPKPMHGLHPRGLLGQDWWDRQRQDAYKRTNYHCAACGVHKTQAKYHHWLEAHEAYSIDYQAGRCRMIEVNALCHSCHSFIHDGLLKVKLEQGQIGYDKYSDILSHGETVLRAAGLVRPDYPSESESIAKWNDWRLIIDGKEYPPLWESFEAWKQHYKTQGKRGMQ